MNAVGPHSTTAELEAADAELTEALKGLLSNVERQLIVDDRREIRGELTKRRVLGLPEPQATSAFKI